ncbi:MAG: HNH endonuclease [Ignavibacteria bacterium]|nr:HNH endonuclease [Ignavibacteria bacterium]
MKWKDLVYQAIIDHCNKKGSRTFSLRNFLDDKIYFFSSLKPNNRHIEEKVRQQLQFLRDSKLINFLDYTGNYTLVASDLLDYEKREVQHIDLSKEKPDRREYIIETYVRKAKWVKMAKQILGYYCIFKNCRNTFIQEDGTPYIEVHHIIPLCHGGEDSMWNLSVLCAHHHRMAHFANKSVKERVQKFLLKEVALRIK